MHLPRLAVSRPIATSMLLLTGILLGAVSLGRLDVALLPEIPSQSLDVWIEYPDADVIEIEQAIARPVEEALIGAPGVREVLTRIDPAGASFELRLHPGANVEIVSLGVRERLDAVRWRLPEGVERPLLGDGLRGAAADLVLALAADDLSLAADWANTVLRQRIEQIEEVARAQLVGVPVPEVRIDPDADRMRSLGISATDIARAVRDANVDAQGGYLRRRGIRYALEIRSRLTTAADVAAVVIERRGGRLIRVGDVAEVIEEVEEARGWSRLDGQPAVGVRVHRAPHASLLALSDAVAAELELIGIEFPEFDVEVVSDPSPFVRQAIAGVWQAIGLGGALAFVVLVAFLREVRSPVFLLCALPISVTTSFAVLELLGVSLNLMSLGGMALGVGMLVDNGIICLENIHRLRATGRSPRTAAAEGAREVALPMLASTLTTCAVFLPLSLVPGWTGALFRDLALAVSVSLLVSLVVAITLLPMLASRFGAHDATATPRPLYARYHRALVRSLERPLPLMAAITVAVLCGVLALLALPRTILPEVATESISAQVELPLGSDVTTTDAAVRDIEAWLAGEEGVETVFVSVGALEGTGDAAAQRGHRATLDLRLSADAVDRRSAIVDGLSERFHARNGLRLEVLAERPELGRFLASAEGTLSAEVRGPDPRAAADLARDLVELANQRVADSHLFTAAVDETEPRFRLDIDDDALWRHRLDESEVLDALAARTSGLEVTELRRFDRVVPVRILDDTGTGSSAALGGELVAGGATFPLSALLDVAAELVPARVLRSGQARVSAVRWDGSLRDVAVARHALDEALAAASLPPGYTLAYTGACAELNRTRAAILRTLALSCGLVLLILAAQFESLVLPFVIFAAVPLALVGVAPALVLGGASLNAMSAVGLVFLVGVVVNDSILKVDLMRRLRGDGLSLRDAVLTASAQRYRPIVMTTLTTILGVLPLLLGRGAELRAPLAITVIGGLSAATALTLFVIPICFERFLAPARRAAVAELPHEPAIAGESIEVRT